MRNLVLTATRLRADTDTQSVDRSINDAYLDVATTLDLNQTQKTVTLAPGKSDYDIVTDFGITDFLSILSIVGPNTGVVTSDPIMEITYPTRILSYRDTQSAIQPTGPYLARAVRRVDADVLPDADERRRRDDLLRLQPLEMYSDGDEPDVVPKGFHRLIEDRAIEFAARWARNSQLSADAHGRYMVGLGEARRFFSERDSATLSVRTAANQRGYRFVPHDRSTDTGLLVNLRLALQHGRRELRPEHALERQGSG
jgi:hypothetical protein